MTFGPFDLRLVEALTERRFSAAQRARISLRRRHYARGAPSGSSGGCNRVALQRPAHSGAAGGN